MSKRNKREAPDLLTEVDDILYDELAALTGQRIVHAVLWEDSLANELPADGGAPASDAFFDLDLYLEEGVYFELYGVVLFPNPEDDPITEADEASHGLLTLVNEQGLLSDVAVDEDDNLVLVLGNDAAARLYLVTGGWLVEEWEELPDE
ncbi:MAG: hypothetical protein H6642_02645 [Caldilineaceae bacterium]|nr:hypothetical protein [Caldilineaceae bacterium]